MNKVFMVILILCCFVLTTACDNKSKDNNVKPENSTNKVNNTAQTYGDSSSKLNNTNEISENYSHENKVNATNIGKDNNEKNSAKDSKSATSNTSVSNTSADIGSFIPKGWHILEKVKGQPAKVGGDLNSDGINDVAMVIEKNGETGAQALPRSLMILLGNKQKSYSISVIATKAVLLSNEGGVFGDPFENITIDRGSVLLSFYGGSNYRWFSYYRFRFQDNGWYLIGATLGSYYNATTTRDKADTEDYNLLTGDYVFKKVNDKGELITTKGNRGKKKLVNLKDFVANSEKKQF